ncbi:hypothetical protein VTN49DRAFT_4762 [Thermomyces lanuginosus]|uniref:uncharacterized protein n=1 Tax=Thermomyces lanuginosus TaxID=5541 RepID=UPI0037433E9A
MGNQPSTPIQTCLSTAVGGDGSLVAFSNEPLYQAKDVKPYNLNVPVAPVAITYPRTVEQVSEIVKCAADGGYKVQARGGGHSYANHALGGGDNNTIVVDMKNFQQFSYDPETQRAKLGAGHRLGDVDDKLHKAGRAMSHGTCPQVGLSGHATIGGLGPTSRLWGSALDHVEEVQVVLANSSVVTASWTENPDLFFAIKGAGASFGVVTEFTVRTQPEPSEAVQYQYIFDFGDTSSRAELFKAWQKFISDPKLPREMASQIILSEHSVTVFGTYFGSKKDFEALQIETAFPSNQGRNVTVLNDWLAVAAAWAQQSSIDLTGDIPANFYSKSMPFRENNLPSGELIDKIFHYLDNTPKGTPLWFIICDLEGGKINDVPVDKTAYSHRDALYWMQSYAINLLGPVSETTYKFLNGLNDLIAEGLSLSIQSAYPGYVDPQLPNPQESYWGENLPRLKQIKAKYDPQDVFHNPHSVPLPDAQAA